MIVSMTGYGSVTEVIETSRGRLEVQFDIKTLNSRYIDLSIRSPRAYSSFDGDLSRLVRKFIRRGRVDISYSVRQLEGLSRQMTVNHSMVAALAKDLEAVRQSLKLDQPVQLSDLIRFPDWIETKDIQLEAQREWPLIENVATKALQVVCEVRATEGSALEQILRGHLDQFRNIFSDFVSKSDRAVSQYKDRWKEKMKSIFASEKMNLEKVDPLRLEQELVMWLGRSDFQEEIDRIRQHLVTFDGILNDTGEPCRKLEFLIQEVQREVNTLGSKCPDAQLTPKVVELKAVIERIREQLQNGE